MQKIVDILIEKIKEEFILQGHRNTGAFEQSVRGEVVYEGDKTTVNIYGLEYGNYLNKGVTADRVPYTGKNRGQGAGNTSQYITGLINWVRTKLGIGGNEGKSIAFAIAHKHSQEGYPVREGKLGSGFIDAVDEKYKAQITKLAYEEMNKIIKKELNKK